MNILVIGDSCIDEYRYGDITRVNPEATVPLLSYEKSEERFGMAQNVYQNLIRLGMNAEFHGPEVLSRKLGTLTAEQETIYSELTWMLSLFPMYPNKHMIIMQL